MRGTVRRTACGVALALMVAGAPVARGEPTEATATVRGTVVFARGGDRFAFLRQDDGRAVRLGLVDGQHVWFGDRVEATGRVTQAEPTRRMEDVTVRKLGEAPLPGATAVTVAALYTPPDPSDPSRPDWFGVPVEVTARVGDVNRRRTQVQLFVFDPAGGDAPGLTASFGLKETDPLDPDLRRGALVRLRGVPSMDYRGGAESGQMVGSSDGQMVGSPGHSSRPSDHPTIRPSDQPTRTRTSTPEVVNLTLNIVGPWEVQVLDRPPWWTPGRVWTAAGLAAFVVALLVAWIAVLGVAVRRTAARLERTVQAKHRDRIEAEAARRERLRLAHDLHDEFQQLLTGTMFQLNAGMNILESDRDAEAAMTHLESARLALQHTQTGLRTVLWTMREEAEGPSSLVALFEYAAQRMPHWKGRVAFAQKGCEHPVARKAAGSLLMILQEAVGNALRHGRAEHIDVTVDYGERALTLTVAHDGEPFDPAAAPGPAEGHFGLEGMRMRAEELGGAFAAARAGVTVTVPYGEV